VEGAAGGTSVASTEAKRTPEQARRRWDGLQGGKSRNAQKIFIKIKLFHNQKIIDFGVE